MLCSIGRELRGGDNRADVIGEGPCCRIFGHCVGKPQESIDKENEDGARGGASMDDPRLDKVKEYAYSVEAFYEN